MSNYVWHRIVCHKETLEQYFLDSDSPTYHTITLNKLFGVKDIDEYKEKYGVPIYYGYSYSWNELPDGLYEIKFCTRWEYPIRAIIRTLELDHDAQWFAVEESDYYVSRFYWLNGVQEDILFLGDEYEQWYEDHVDYDNPLDDPDREVWHYLPHSTGTWHNWKSDDGFARYLDTPVIHVEKPPFQK